MLIYETNLANIDLAKATRATLGSPILYLFLENIRDVYAFIFAGIRLHILAPSVFIDSLPRCTVWIFVL